MAKYLDATGVSILWGKIKSSFASTSHTHDYLPLSGGTLTGNLNLGSGSVLAFQGTAYFDINGTYQPVWSPDSISRYVMWTSGNDGSDSGLDADLLDGQHGSYYATASSLSSYLPLSAGASRPLSGMLYIGSSTTTSQLGVRITRKESGTNVYNSVYVVPGVEDDIGLDRPVVVLRKVNGSYNDAVLAFDHSEIHYAYGTKGQNFSYIATVLHSDNIGSYAITKSGGKISNSNRDLLILNQTIQSTPYGPYILLQVDNSQVGSVGFNSSIGTFLTNHYNGADDYINVKSDGLYWKNTDKFLNAGNYSSYALPISGGTITGTTYFPLTIDTTSTVNALTLKIDGTRRGAIEVYSGTYGTLMAYGDGTNENYVNIAPDGVFKYNNTYTFLHSGNYSSYVLPISGGDITTTSGTPLDIFTTANHCYLRFYKSNSLCLELSHESGTYGTCLSNIAASGSFVNIASDGVFKYNNNYPFLHSNNYTSYTDGRYIPEPTSGVTTTTSFRTFNTSSETGIGFYRGNSEKLYVGTYNDYAYLCVTNGAGSAEYYKFYYDKAIFFRPLSVGKDSAPSYTLDVDSGANSSYALRLNSTTSETSMLFSLSGTAKGCMGAYSSGVFLYNFTSGNNVHLNDSGYFVTPSRVSIGMGDNPSYMLDVAGTINATGNLYCDGGKFGLGWSITGRSNLLLNSTAGYPADIIFRSGTYTNGTWGDWTLSSRGNESGSNNNFYIARGGYNNGNPSESCIIQVNANGNVMIGQNVFSLTPAYQLDISGSANATTLYENGNRVITTANIGSQSVSSATSASSVPSLTNSDIDTIIV